MEDVFFVLERRGKKALFLHFLGWLGVLMVRRSLVSERSETKENVQSTRVQQRQEVLMEPGGKKNGHELFYSSQVI